MFTKIRANGNQIISCKNEKIKYFQRNPCTNVEMNNIKMKYYQNNNTIIFCVPSVIL